MSHPVSPLAPKALAALPPIIGVRLATAAAGIRYQDRTDVLYVAFDQGAAVAGVFTRSKCPSAPVDWCRRNLGVGAARALVVNSGNANAFTGMKGAQAAGLTAEIAARVADCRPDQVFLASTGVIGEPLDAQKFDAVLADCDERADAFAWPDAAKAIMTTDTFPKLATRTAILGGVEVAINGIAKGAGMIAPDMATMLAFVFTDAPVTAAALQPLLSRGADKSFNCVTVDSDTSTSDTLLMFSTGTALPRGAPVIDDHRDVRLRSFRRALDDLLTDLARQVARDGEGARKFVTVDVEGATSARSARRIALSIANSPLVKTAIAGEDANWGRIVMAVGKAGEKANRDKLAVSIGGVVVAKDGQRVDGYDETPVAAHIKGRDIKILVDVGVGGSKATVWTCDLTHRYIDINAGYRS
ncbi:MAG: bifunctional glutamate N-acetyltransferase/amino-acid acetyltransferase ArgJ [Microvirga sp.]